jgi:hypothetical protein
MFGQGNHVGFAELAFAAEDFRGDAFAADQFSQGAGGR